MKDIENPLNINKYNLFRFVVDTSLMSDDDQFDMGFDLSYIIKEQYEKIDSPDLEEPIIFEYDEEKTSIMYVLGDKFYKDSVSFALNEMDIEYELYDITNDFLNLKIDLECSDENRIEKFNKFYDISEDFKMAHITFDKVFEKLADKGIESLTIREKDFLDKSV